jgi:hypothetical protein
MWNTGAERERARRPRRNKPHRQKIGFNVPCFQVAG